VSDLQACDFLTSGQAPNDSVREAINRAYLANETEAVRSLLAQARLDPAAEDRVNQRARSLVGAVRARRADQGLLDAFMQEYDLSSEEGVILMCLAEALLRIPDADTAEKLIAEKGMAGVSIREIVKTAEQKNESALQYHFKNLEGLIQALRKSRNREIDERRSLLIEEALSKSPELTLRDICRLMVAPAFELSRSSASFRRYLRAFGHEITHAEASALAVANRTGGASTQRLGTYLREALPHLDEEAFRRRMDSALRFISASMVHQAGQKNAFRGSNADVFFNSLIDALVGMLSAPESEDTQQARRGALE